MGRRSRVRLIITSPFAKRHFVDPERRGANGPVPGMHHSVGLTQSSLTLPFPNLRLTSFTLNGRQGRGLDSVQLRSISSVGE